MKKIIISLIVFSIFTVSVNASLIRYDIIGGFDNYNNPFSGYVDIDDQPLISEYIISYNILNFHFYSDGGSFLGSYGLLQFIAYDDYYGPGTGPGVICENYSSASFYGDNGVYWNNDNTGAWFVGTDPTIYGYSILPQEICFISDCMLRLQDWGPCGAGDIITLEQQVQPVPEPGTMILLGLALISFVGLREKLKTDILK